MAFFKRGRSKAKAGEKSTRKVVKAKVSKPRKVREPKPEPVASEPITEADATPKCLLTYIGPGPLSGEYRFKEIAGSIGAGSEEEAFEKANDIALRHPALLNK